MPTIVCGIDAFHAPVERCGTAGALAAVFREALVGTVGAPDAAAAGAIDLEVYRLERMRPEDAVAEGDAMLCRVPSWRFDLAALEAMHTEIDEQKVRYEELLVNFSRTKEALMALTEGATEPPKVDRGIRMTPGSSVDSNISSPTIDIDSMIYSHSLDAPLSARLPLRTGAGGPGHALAYSNAGAGGAGGAGGIRFGAFAVPGGIGCGNTSFAQVSPREAPGRSAASRPLWRRIWAPSGPAVGASPVPALQLYATHGSSPSAPSTSAAFVAAVGTPPFGGHRSSHGGGAGGPVASAMSNPIYMTPMAAAALASPTSTGAAQPALIGVAAASVLEVDRAVPATPLSATSSSVGPTTSSSAHSQEALLSEHLSARSHHSAAIYGQALRPTTPGSAPLTARSAGVCSERQRIACFGSGGEPETPSCRRQYVL